MKWREAGLLKRLKVINIINKGEEFLEIVKWISVKDRYPDEDVYVLVAAMSVNKDLELYKMYIMNHMDGFWYNEYTGEELDCQYEIITHWMSLPKHPQKNSLSDV